MYIHQCSPQHTYSVRDIGPIILCPSVLSFLQCRKGEGPKHWCGIRLHLPTPHSPNMPLPLSWGVHCVNVCTLTCNLGGNSSTLTLPSPSSSWRSLSLSFFLDFLLLCLFPLFFLRDPRLSLRVMPPLPKSNCSEFSFTSLWYCDTSQPSLFKTDLQSLYSYRTKHTCGSSHGQVRCNLPQMGDKKGTGSSNVFVYLWLCEWSFSCRQIIGYSGFSSVSNDLIYTFTFKPQLSKFHWRPCTFMNIPPSA